MVEAGRCRDGYRFEERTAASAIVDTWRATDIQRGTPCEVRVPSARAADRAALFAQCAQAQRVVVHPNRLQILDVLDLDGIPAVVTDAATGPTLATWARMRRRTLDEILPVFEDVARGVAAVHHIGLHHLQIDSRAIWMHSRRHLFVPKIELALGPVLDGAPWLAFGRVPVVDGVGAPGAQRDLFQLGALLFELITGRLPFDAEALTRGVPPMPELRHPFEEVDPDLADLVAQLLASDPYDRPRRVDDVIGALSPNDDFLAPFRSDRGPTLAPPTDVPVADRGAAPPTDSDTGDHSVEASSGADSGRPTATGAADRPPIFAAPTPWRQPLVVASVVAAMLAAVGALVWLGG